MDGTCFSGQGESPDDEARLPCSLRVRGPGDSVAGSPPLEYSSLARQEPEDCRHAQRPILEVPSPLSPSVPESDISVAMKTHDVMNLACVVYKDKV